MSLKLTPDEGQAAAANEHLPVPATWLPVKANEESPLVWLRENRKAVLLSSLAVCFFAFSQLIRDPHFGWKVVSAMGEFGGFVLFTLASADLWKTSLKSRLKRTLDDPEDPDQLLAEIFVIQDGLMTGYDAGTLTAIDNALVFSGQSTSFCIGYKDVFTSNQLQFEQSLQHTEKGLKVRLQSTTGRLELDINWIGSDRIDAYGTLKRRCPTSLVRTYPPLTLGPGIRPPMRSWRTKQGAASAIGLPLSFAIGLSSHSILNAFLSMAAFIILVALCPKPRKLRHKLAVYQKLKAERDSAQESA